MRLEDPRGTRADYPDYPRGPRPLGERIDPCEAIQFDLSCMVDGEADQAAIRRALIHVEACPACQAFLQHVRGHLELHRDLCDPLLLMRRLRTVGGLEMFTRSSIRANQRRLSEFFYQLGKAYLLLATDEQYLLQVFEEPVPVAGLKKKGRGFVDGVLASGRVEPDRPRYEYEAAEDLRELEMEAGASYDWVKARSLLNGRLEILPQNLDKARVLLEEALLVRPRYAEARLYLGFYHQAIKELEKAEQEYRRVFETARAARNRAHAAVQLGVINHERGELHSAIRCFRWVTRSGMVRKDSRFYFVFYNLGLLYARLDDFERCLKCFEILHNRYRSRQGEIQRFLERAGAFRELLDEHPRFAEALAEACPVWFQDRPASAEASSEDASVSPELSKCEDERATQGLVADCGLVEEGSGSDLLDDSDECLEKNSSKDGDSPRRTA